MPAGEADGVGVTGGERLLAVVGGGPAPAGPAAPNGPPHRRSAADRRGARSSHVVAQPLGSGIEQRQVRSESPGRVGAHVIRTWQACAAGVAASALSSSPAAGVRPVSVREGPPSPSPGPPPPPPLPSASGAGAAAAGDPVASDRPGQDRRAVAAGKDRAGRGDRAAGRRGDRHHRQSRRRSGRGSGPPRPRSAADRAIHQAAVHQVGHLRRHLASASSGSGSVYGARAAGRPGRPTCQGI